VYLVFRCISASVGKLYQGAEKKQFLVSNCDKRSQIIE
jgi:hypothetical protein